jgi:uncharacterized SAM-binding protein YcdF (DUF218 family)
VSPQRPSIFQRVALGAGLGAGAGLLFLDLGLQRALPYHGERAWLVLAGGVFGMVVWPTRLRGLLAGGLVFMGLLWLAVTMTPLSRALCEGLVRRDPPSPEPADAVFVMASGVQTDGELGSIGLARLERGLSELRAGHAPRLLLANIDNRPSHREAVARIITELRLEVELVEVGSAATTRDEALLAARLFREKGWKRVVLVTSPLHSRRAAAVFEKVGLEVVSSPASETGFDLETLIGADNRLEAFGNALHERVGSLVYGWRGWL